MLIPRVYLDVIGCPIDGLQFSRASYSPVLFSGSFLYSKLCSIHGTIHVAHCGLRITIH